MASNKKKDYHEAIQNVVEHLKAKRNELVSEICNDELEKAKVLGEMDKLKDKLSILDANLKKKSEFRKDYDKAINQSEGHFVELIQKSEDFLARARREALALSHAVEGKKHCEDKGSAESGVISQQEKPSQEPCQIPCQPAAIISFQPPEPGNTANCINCSNNYTCTTIAVPYRANGL